MTLRKLGLKTECYLGNKSKGAQFAFAESNGIPYVVCSEENGIYTIKEIATRQMLNLTAKQLSEKVK